MKSDYHLPVLLKESINGLKIDDEGIYVDATFGGGGHSLEILRSLSKKGRLVSFDQDPDSINNSYEEFKQIIEGRLRNTKINSAAQSLLNRIRRKALIEITG